MRRAEAAVAAEADAGRGRGGPKLGWAEAVAWEVEVDTGGSLAEIGGCEVDR